MISISKRIKLIPLCFLATCSLYAAEDVKVAGYLHAGPFTVNKPIISDSLNVNGKSFETKDLLKTKLSFERALISAGEIQTDTAGIITVDKPEKGYALNVYAFYLNADRYVKGTLDVSGPGLFEVYVNNKLVTANSELPLEPQRYEVVIKYLTTAADTAANTLKVVYKTAQEANITASINPQKRYTGRDIMDGKNLTSVRLSANGKYALANYIMRYDEGKTERFAQLREVATNRVLFEDKGFLLDAGWMPVSNKLYYTRLGANGRELVITDPATGEITILANQLPEGNFSFTPDEKTLLFTCKEEGPKEGPNMLRVIEPNDRLPGFRDRYFIWRYDLQTGLYEQLTFGHTSTYINDISADSRYMLFSTSHQDYTSVPHYQNSLYKLDLQTLAIDTLWEKSKYVNGGTFSPDGKQLLISGSGGAFGGIGLNIKPEQSTNTYDAQLFIYNPATKEAKAITKHFDPNVLRAEWSKYDGRIYMLTEDQDYQRMYCYNPANQEMQMLPLGEDVINTYSLAENAPILYYFGQSVSNANRMYCYNIKSKKNELVYDLSAERLKDVKLGKVEDWNFKTDDGTTIQGRYYLPPNFDPDKKYPLIVYYYGGTAPTNRSLEFSYSMHMYASKGYVVYTLNPSGTTGFGQEFAARHVNAWGDRTADEIIKGTELFCQTHKFVDPKRIGCAGASYGGFMTQYLQTKTDLFAAAVSHAGISALSSYWGEGFWGYGYCSVANTGTYPWTNPEFFTKHSPLFNADKIKTPLLLLHGTVDTNVPIGESIQMFLALKLLGKPVEFIQVEGENHGIVDYKKRLEWQNTIFAWFAKWLKDEPEWWDALYPERNL